MSADSECVGQLEHGSLASDWSKLGFAGTVPALSIHPGEGGGAILWGVGSYPQPKRFTPSE